MRNRLLSAAVPIQGHQRCLPPPGAKGAQARGDAASAAQGGVSIPHLALQVVGQTHLVDQLQLGFEEVNVFFGVVKDVLQQIT